MKIILFDAMVEIEIDKIDLPLVQTNSWAISGWGYIYATSSEYVGKCLHQIIAERMRLDLSNLIDHRDGNPLNNQRFNLRPATNQQNTRNRKIPITNKSGFKGVYWCKVAQKWRARIRVNGEQIYLGHFNTAVGASEAYKLAAKLYHGEFARAE